MLEPNNIKEEFNKFGKYVVQQARTNLTKKRINASKGLYNSLKYEVRQDKNSIFIDFYANEYGDFIDKGVKGSKSTYAESRNSPYKYSGTKKMIPTKALDQWVIKRKLKGIRDDKGRFIPRKTLKYIIAKSIYQKGIKATLFFTKPFERAYENLPEDLMEAFAKDINENLKDGR